MVGGGGRTRAKEVSIPLKHARLSECLLRPPERAYYLGEAKLTGELASAFFLPSAAVTAAACASSSALLAAAVASAAAVSLACLALAAMVSCIAFMAAVSAWARVFRLAAAAAALSASATVYSSSAFLFSRLARRCSEAGLYLLILGDAYLPALGDEL